MTTKDQLAKYSAELTSTYRDAVSLLGTQPEAERGAVIILDTLGQDLNAVAYGSPEQWANMLLSIATRNQDFALALILAYQHLEIMATKDDE